MIQVGDIVQLKRDLCGRPDFPKSGDIAVVESGPDKVPGCIHSFFTVSTVFGKTNFSVWETDMDVVGHVDG